MDAINSSAQIEDLKKTYDMVLVYFSSSLCGVCRDIKPKLEKVLETFPSIKSAEIEAPDVPELSASYHVFIFPVIILFIQGKETLREAGIISLDSLEQKISRYYSLFYGGS